MNAPPEGLTDPVVSVRDLTVRFGNVTAVDGVGFDLFPGETLALVGESGSGKSVTGLSIMRLVELSSTGRMASGSIWLRRKDAVVDLCALSERELRRIRGHEISMIFQEPLTCLNPLFTVGEQIAESLRLHKHMRRRAARSRAVELMDLVRISDASRRAREYPHQLSGGMRQRVMIAMALACEPLIMIADEPTTALDVTIQAQVLTLITDLQAQLKMAVLFITHNMGVVAEIADRVVVMEKSHIIEQGDVRQIFERPSAAYTKQLLSAVPRLGSMSGVDRPARFDMP